MQSLSANEFRARLKWEQETLYVLQNQSLMKQIFHSSKTALPSKELTQEEIHAEFGPLAVIMTISKK